MQTLINFVYEIDTAVKRITLYEGLIKSLVKASGKEKITIKAEDIDKFVEEYDFSINMDNENQTISVSVNKKE